MAFAEQFGRDARPKTSARVRNRSFDTHSGHFSPPKYATHLDRYQLLARCSRAAAQGGERAATSKPRCRRSDTSSTRFIKQIAMAVKRSTPKCRFTTHLHEKARSVNRPTWRPTQLLSSFSGAIETRATSWTAPPSALFGELLERARCMLRSVPADRCNPGVGLPLVAAPVGGSQSIGLGIDVSSCLLRCCFSPFAARLWVNQRIPMLLRAACVS